MSPPEIVFLALGLILGSAVGAALVEALRNRPVSRREVRLTIAPYSVRTRRPLTLSSSEPTPNQLRVPGSPDDDAWLERRLAGNPGPAGATTSPEPKSAATRTRVPSGPVHVPESAVAVPVARAAETGMVTARPPVSRAGRAEGDVPGDIPGASGAARAPAPTVVLDRDEPGPGSVEPPPASSGRWPKSAPRDHAAAPPGVRPRPPVAEPRPVVPSTSVALSIQPEASRDRDALVAREAAPMSEHEARPMAAFEPSADAAGAAEPATAPSVLSGCEGERTQVEERCALADAAREQARRSAEALREAQKAYDALREQVDRAQLLADPREVRASKDALHQAFRAARAAATTTEEAEAAAREWLTEINRLNTAARDAAHVVATGTTALRERLPGLERLAVEADAARITAESAEATCQEARAALARCEEQAVRAATEAAASAAAEAVKPVASTLDGIWPTEPEEPLPAAGGGLIPGDDSAPVIRVLRGDRAARDRLVATVAGSDADALRQWHLRIAGLMDAIVARAIEDGYLVLPDDGFWGLFSRHEQREIVSALSALGFRFDGMGGFADERVPAQRDLSLAVGYAGLDRMRIRMWPREADLAGLYHDARIAADEWLVDAAGDLSLPRMVDALGGRAGELAEIWNAWGRVRPALLGEI